jgi:hypothetical protein
MKKITVAALGIAFAFSAVAASAAMTYTRDLTIGSTGADVISLQTTLVSKGFLVIPATVQKGYFGALTKAALSNYQKSVGISPAVGYFGPVTRAHFNAMTDSDMGGDDGDDDEDNGDLQGGEGDIKDFDVLGNPSSTDLDEGQTDEVLGFEFEAEDSDIRVERLDILASTSAGSPASDEPWDYIESARLMLDGDEVAEVTDLDDEDIWDDEGNDTYSFRFEDIDVVVEEDETAKFYVEFTAVDRLDSDDEGTEFNVAIADFGLRAVDAEGIDIYAGDEGDTVSVTFEGTEAGDLDISIDEDDNEDRTVFVDEDSETKGIEIMRFTIEANASVNTIDELAIRIASTSNPGNDDVADVFTSLSLEVDGDEIASESIPSGAATATITFEDLEDDFEIADGDEVEVVILADIDEQEDNYTEGYSFKASLSTTSIEAEDAEGDDIDFGTQADIYGGEIELRVDGLTVELTDRPSAVSPLANDESKGRFFIEFEVTTSGDDVFIPTGATTVSAVGSGQGVQFKVVDGNGSTAVATTTLANNNLVKVSGGSQTGNFYKISKNNSAIFQLEVVVDNINAASSRTLGIEMEALNYKIGSAATADTQHTAGIDEDFRSKTAFLLTADAS